MDAADGEAGGAEVVGPERGEPRRREAAEADGGNGARKASRFTLEYLRERVGRQLDEREAERLQKLIDKGEDRGVFALLFGSGADQRWQCQLCSTLIRGTVREVASHYRDEHQAEPLYPCQLCGKVIKSVHTYKRHRTAHLSEYRCPVCDRVFHDRSKLLAHRATHSDNRPHTCHVCHKKFKMVCRSVGRVGATYATDEFRFRRRRTSSRTWRDRTCPTASGWRSRARSAANASRLRET